MLWTKKHIQLLTIPLGRREEMNMNVTVTVWWMSLLEWYVSGHLIASTTEFHRILQILWLRAERRENVEMGSFTMFVVAQVGQLSLLGGHTKPPQPFSKEWNKITPFRFRLSALWPKYFCRVEMRWDISSKLIISWQGRADPAKSNTWDDEMSVNQRLNILPAYLDVLLVPLTRLGCCDQPYQLWPWNWEKLIRICQQRILSTQDWGNRRLHNC